MLEQTIQFDSTDEQYFADWLNELKAYHLIYDWQHNHTSYKLTDGLVHNWTDTQVLKTKTKTVEKKQILLRPSEYTPDFLIYWSLIVGNLLFNTLGTKGKLTAPFMASWVDGAAYSVVEIKPDFDRNNMTRAFIMNQKFMWEKHREFINLIHIKELFQQTFTPASYLLTPTGKDRKIGWIPVSIEEFIHANKIL